MIAEVISIGDELTSGQRLDTNSQWLSQRLGELGIQVLYHTTVGDDLAANVRVFQQAIDRADVVVATGGLGPTADDLTREALAEAAGRPLYRDEGAVEHIRALFARRRRAMPERNLVQAMFPAGSGIVPNPQGSAPGIDLVLDRPGRGPARVFALPGVPAEMHEMWQQTVAPALAAQLGDTRRVIQIRTVNCFGVGESDLEAMLPDLIRRGRQPSVGITVSRATISLRIAAEARTAAECVQQIAETERVIHACLGELVFGYGEDELQHEVLRLCAKLGKSLAVADAGSGGLLVHWLSEADSGHHPFVGGIVPRRREVRTAEQTQELAAEVRAQFGADLGLALSCFPQYDETSPPGQIHVAVAGLANSPTASFSFTGHPEILQPRAVKQALNFLRLQLIRIG
jgi:nicotinamide-nucleotide amidase